MEPGLWSERAFMWTNVHVDGRSPEWAFTWMGVHVNGRLHDSRSERELQSAQSHWMWCACSAVLCPHGNATLRTKTNAFIVSLAVADFCVGLDVIPFLFACDVTNTCYWPQNLLSWVTFIRLLFSSKSAVNLCGLLLDRFVAIVHPLKYITFMTRRRIVRITFFSWVL